MVWIRLLSQFLYIKIDICYAIALYRSLHEIMGNPDCDCIDNPNAVHNSVTLALHEGN
ncbi:MAG: hypothetical protein QG646_1450 [Euryarchaeota archaeon]|nr:hypothetical protein [Euryarchaeota archaeon]